MSVNPNGGGYGTEGNGSRSFPPVVVDCSDWEPDIPAEKWSHGRGINAVRPLPAVVLDGAAWDNSGWIELAASLDAATPAQVVDRANRLTATAAAAAPDLGLAYDFARSRAENDDVVIALKPQHPATPERLREVAAAVERAVTGIPGVRRVVVTVARAA